MNLNSEQYFSLAPRVQAPRSVFDLSHKFKFTMNTDYLVPILCIEALPGDTFDLDFQCFGRLVNPLRVSLMDELYFETLWFKTYNVFVWDNWRKFCGEQLNPNDSTDYTVPTVDIKNQPYGSLSDYFNLANLSNSKQVNSLPYRHYNLIYNWWFRDENLVASVPVPMGDTDDISNYTLLKSAKIHDYFTSGLVSPQKGDPVSVPFSFSTNSQGNVYDPNLSENYLPVDVYGNGNALNFGSVSTNPTGYFNQVAPQGYLKEQTVSGQDYIGAHTNLRGDYTVTGESASNVSSGAFNNNVALGVTTLPQVSGLKGRLDIRQLEASGVSIQDFVFAMKLQQKRVRDALGGTRYNEIILNHFGVSTGDNSLFRPEFLGSTREMIDINNVIQTSSTDTTSPLGTVASYGVISHHSASFKTSFADHGFLIGISRIRHNPLYCQGLHRMWTRSVNLDYYLPVFNGIGEQPTRNDELYCQGDTVLDSNGRPIDELTFNYHEAWSEYRQLPDRVAGLLRPTSDNSTLGAFTLAHYWTELPVYNKTFIEEDTDMDRVLSVNTSPTTPQFVIDMKFNISAYRCMPVRDVLSTLATVKTI